MAAFKLETFEMAPANGGLHGLRNAVIERERNEAYAQGFKDGVDVTKKAVDVERNQRLAQIEEALSDLSITHEAASVSIQRTLAPLLSSFLNALAPTLARAGLIDLISERIETAFRNNNAGRLTVVATPETGEKLVAELAGKGHSIALEPAPSDTGDRVEIHWAGGVDVIDMDAHLADIKTLILAQIGRVEEDNQDERQRTG